MNAVVTLSIRKAGSLVLFALLIAAGVHGAPPAQAQKKNPRLKVVKAFASANSPGAVATATATCPKTTRRDLGPWRAISAGFDLGGVVPGFSNNGPPLPPSGSAVVYESRKVGQRSWRVSAQDLSGSFTLKVSLYCQNGVPKTNHAGTTVSTPGSSQLGPSAVAKCRSGRTVSGGFSTPPPFTPAGTANLVIASMPSGQKAWKAQVLSSQASSLTSYVYCAKRGRVRVVHSFAGEPSSRVTQDGTEAFGNTAGKPCPAKGRFLPGGGGFSEEGLTTTQYLIPVGSHQQGSGTGWHTDGLKVGSGVPVTLRAHLVCG